jgi:hypothetical protein
LISWPLRAAGPTTRPATNPALVSLDKQIAQTILELDSPDGAVREKATLKLINIGPRVLKALKAAMNDDASPEFTARAKGILEEITKQWRYVDEHGGNVVGGFQAVLGGREEFEIGHPISLMVVFRCVGTNGHKLAETRTVDIELPDSGVIFSVPQSEAKLVIKKIGEAKLPEKGMAVVCSSGEPHVIDFNVGGSVNTAIWIDKELELSAGVYELRFVYYAQSKALLDEALEDLESNSIKIRVK